MLLYSRMGYHNCNGEWFETRVQYSHISCICQTKFVCKRFLVWPIALLGRHPIYASYVAVNSTFSLDVLYQKSSLLILSSRNLKLNIILEAKLAVEASPHPHMILSSAQLQCGLQKTVSTHFF